MDNKNLEQALKDFINDRNAFEFQHELESYIRQNQTFNNITLYRGLMLPLEQLKIGQTYQHTVELSSWTEDINVAIKFANENYIPEDNLTLLMNLDTDLDYVPVVLHIDNCKSFNVCKYNQQEKEHICYRLDSKIIDVVEKDNNGKVIYYVYLKYIEVDLVNDSSYLLFNRHSIPFIEGLLCHANRNLTITRHEGNNKIELPITKEVLLSMLHDFFGNNDYLYEFKNNNVTWLCGNYDRIEQCSNIGKVNKIVNSGAGTGKTTYMRKCIDEYLQKSWTSQKDILGITFTNRAGANMRKGLSKYSEIMISSLHSYLIPKVMYKDIIPDDMLSNILETSLKSLNKGKGKYDKINRTKLDSYINSWQTYCITKSASNNCTTYEQLRSMLLNNNLINDYLSAKGAKGEDINVIRPIIKEIQNIFRQIYNNGYVTFDDIILQGYFLKDNDIKYILIDEFQDLRYIEYLTLVTLSDNAQYLILCDQYQGIYQWRNSSFSYNLNHFTKTFPNVETVNLNVNYRCSKKVAKLSSMFSGRGEVIVNRDIEGSLAVIDSKDYLEQILNYVNNIPTDENIAILCQSNMQCGAVANYLKLNNVKNIDHKVRNFNSECEPVRIFLKLLNYFKSVHNTTALKTLMADSYFVNKFQMSMFEVLKLFNGITSEQILFGKYSLTKEHPYHYVVFDTETTGLDVENDDIIQISAQKLDNNFNVIAEFDEYIYTKKDLSQTQNVHNISNDFLKENGKPVVEVLYRFLDFIRGCVLVGHNVGYDVSILSNHLSRYNLASELGYPVDTLDLARTYLPNKVSYKLEYLNQELNLGCNPNHNSKYDVEATVNLLKYIIANWQPKEVSEYAIKYYHNVLDIYRDWHDQDLLKMYEKICKNFQLTETQHMFSEMFKLNLKAVCSKYKDLGKIVNFFTMNDELDLDTSKITICTIHQSKGLEFDNVIYIQSYNSKTLGQGSESTNVEYVTITRAKNNFIIVKNCNTSNIANAINQIE